MKECKDYLGNKINKGDIVLYNTKGSNGYHSSFSEGIIIAITGKVVVLDINYLSEYNNIIEYFNRWNCYPRSSYRVNSKIADNVINLTALGLRENRIGEIE